MTSTVPSWITSFPGNFKWSNAALVCKGMAPYGAVALQEIDRIAAALQAGAGDTESWRREWCGMADRLIERAEAADAAAHSRTAGRFFLRAGNYYYTGERFVPPGEEKLATYRKALAASQAGLRRCHPEIEFVDVPFEDTSLAAYFLPAAGTTGPAPTVVLFNGMDNCKEMSVLFAGLEFSRRGMNTLAIDGPGQGESLRLRKIFARPDYETAGSAAYDYVAGRAEVNPGKVAVVGYSMGGYYAPRVAAFDHRYAACVAFGAMHSDFHAWQLHMKSQMDKGSQNSSQSNFQLQFILGIADWDAAMEVAKKFTLAGLGERIRCPVLITHGADDMVVPVEAAYTLRDLIGAERAELKIFTAEEGGAAHCQVDDRQQGVDYIADWLTDRLGAAA